MKVSREQFEDFVDWAVEQTPPLYRERLQNVAFLVEDDPTPEQRMKLQLRGDQTLLGLYEGVPLPQRGGAVKLLPDKITIFKNSLTASSRDLANLKENIRHTVWHEIAHYFGLNHDMIYARDGNSHNNHKK